MKLTEEKKLDLIIHRMTNDASEDAPDEAMTYVKGLFRTRTASRGLSLIERVVAVLRTDIAPGAMVYGQRSAGSAEARQMLFETAANAVDLRITGGNIRGQVLGDGFESGDAVLTTSAAKLTAGIDEMGEFSFDDVASGEVSLAIRSDKQEIVIEKFSI